MVLVQTRHALNFHSQRVRLQLLVIWLLLLLSSEELLLLLLLLLDDEGQVIRSLLVLALVLSLRELVGVELVCSI